MRRNAGAHEASYPVAAAVASPAAQIGGAAREDGRVPTATHPGAVKSPMVGTVYLSPEPNAPAFVAVGDAVKEGQTLLLVEAMKTFNEIKAPHGGVLRQILVENQQPVEYGEILAIIA